MQAKGKARALIAGVGGAQLIGWGTLYYAVAVIGEPMRHELGLSRGKLFGAFSWSLCLSGMLSPWIGKVVDRYGGRLVLATSTLVGGLGLALLATAHSLTMLVVAWSILGLAMAMGLYETAFAALAQAAPHAYRHAVTAVTLIAGFASSAVWPLSHYLTQSLGWRMTCLIFALALLLCMPVYLVVLPTRGKIAARPRVTRVASATSLPARKARWLAFAFAGASWISAAVSAHLVNTLHSLQLEPVHAVWAASSLGGLQVLGRLLELSFGSRQNAIQLGAMTFVGLTASIMFLLAAIEVPWLVYIFLVLYGLANGLLTIVKAALPVELFGLEHIGAVLGSFSAPSLMARAIAALAYAAAVGSVGYGGALVSLAVVGMASLAAYAFATQGYLTVHAEAYCAYFRWPLRRWR